MEQIVLSLDWMNDKVIIFQVININVFCAKIFKVCLAIFWHYA